MKILSIIGSLITGVVLILQWYFSDDQSKIRRLKDDEKAQKELEKLLNASKGRAQLGDIQGSYDLLVVARKHWLDSLHKKNRTR